METALQQSLVMVFPSIFSLFHLQRNCGDEVCVTVTVGAPSTCSRITVVTQVWQGHALGYRIGGSHCRLWWCSVGWMAGWYVVGVSLLNDSRLCSFLLVCLWVSSCADTFSLHWYLGRPGAFVF